MRNTLLIILTFIVVPFIYGQDDQVENFRELYKEKKYDKIIKFKSVKDSELPAKALYYKGMSYFMKSEDDDAMKYLSLAIEKGPVDYDMFYYKGMLLFFAEKFNEALPYYDKAIELLPGEPDFYASKGETYYSLKKIDSAIVYYEKATKLPDCKASDFIALGLIYQDVKKTENALAALKSALELLTSSDENYRDCLFNVGLMQQLTGNDLEAKETFEKYVSAYPTDYQAVAKLIQMYYALSEPDKAIPYKEKMYAAHKAKKLPESMTAMFCFNQFKWKNKIIMAFEFFDEYDDGFLSVKYKFYVTDKNGNIEYFIQSESSPEIRKTDGKYILGLVKDDKHYAYWSYKFNDDFDYKTLKEQVIKILNEEVKPEASTIKN